MAKLRFLKEGEKSQKKNYIPNSIKFNKIKRFWMVLSFLEALLLYYIMNKG